jgi:hypothetical protein
MAEYTVRFVNATDASVVVEADSVEAAVAAAESSFGYSSLCHQCSDGRNDGDWIPTFVTDAAGVEHDVS